MSILYFESRFPDEETCWKRLQDLRWPDGAIVCPACGSIGDAAPWKHRPRYWQCRCCRTRFHAAQGSAIEGSHLALHTWFKAIYLLDADPDVSSIELGKHLGLRQKTAWSLKGRVVGAAGRSDPLLRAIAEVVGGTGAGRGKSSRRPSAKQASRFSGDLP